MSISKKTVWILLDGLKVLSDRDEQRRLWLSTDPSIVASFREERTMLIGDSGLSDSLKEGGTGLGREADEVLQQLVRVLRSVDCSKTEEQIIDSAEMGAIRNLATTALRLIGHRAEELPD